MNPFLYSIAETYIVNEPENLIDYCFVFPNKRSATFFSYAVAKASRAKGVEIVQPATTTISEFIEDFTDGVPADRMEMIFILYRAYRRIIFRREGGTKEAQEIAEMVDFNKFQFWADIIIGDFSDVDMSLVDARQLFRNIDRLKEIKANYLEEEQIEAIRRHWPDEKIPKATSDFWNHVVYENGEESASRSFVKLWQVLDELYYEFRHDLTTKGLYYPGMAYRATVDKLRGMSCDDFAYQRYIFVGFNMLSPAEDKIFSLLRDKSVLNSERGPLADFYWDNASPAFREQGNTTVWFLENYSKQYPSLYDCIEPIATFPQIKIIGLPSRIGQTKLIGEIVCDLYPRNTNQTVEEFHEALRRTAIVLPEENLSIPLLHSLPEYISPINITMGYSLKGSSIAGLIRDIVAMQMHSGRSGGTCTFFHEDVVSVLTHPLLRELQPELCSRIIFDINIGKWFNVPADYFQRSDNAAFAQIFRSIPNQYDTNAVFSYLIDLLRWILEAIHQSNQKESDDGSDMDYDIDGTPISLQSGLPASKMIDWALIKSYLSAVERLKSLSLDYLKEKDIYLGDYTIFHLVERMVAGETVSFEGRPLRGLQIMGVLEARSLDFENVILPSMNERIFPRRHYRKSFIPNDLRSAFGMSTTEHQESIYSYYFFRMISRAKRVFLLYDARTTGTRNGRMSRYLNQLNYIYRPEKLHKTVRGYHVGVPNGRHLEVKKTPAIMAELNRFISEDNPRWFSASSINLYITCPLSFYLAYIENYSREDEIHDYMDEGTYGTIVHQVTQDLYDQQLSHPDGGKITPNVLDMMSNDVLIIEKLIRWAINEHYNHLGKNNDTPLHGDSLIYAALIKRYMQTMLRREKKLGTFTYLYSEKESRGRLHLCSSESMDENESDTTHREMTVNFYCKIDRIDRLILENGESLLRVVDYKTGADPTELKSIEDMFTSPNEYQSRAKAVLQLFLYCQALEQFEKMSEPMMPLIYQLRKVAVCDFEPIKISKLLPGKKQFKKTPITDFHEYVGMVNARLIDYLEELFDPEIPFRAATDNHACRFCKFVDMCRKTSRLS